MGLFEDFSNFLESRLEEFLQNNPKLELQALSDELKQQQRDTIKLVNQLQLEEQGVESEILKVAKDIQTWHGRIEKAKSARRLDLVEEAQARENNLLSKGNLLWTKMQDLKQRINKSKELLISIEEKQKEVTLKIAQLKAAEINNNSDSYQTENKTNYQSSNNKFDPLENKFQEWEMEQELNDMKKNIN